MFTSFLNSCVNISYQSAMTVVHGAAEGTQFLAKISALGENFKVSAIWEAFARHGKDIDLNRNIHISYLVCLNDSLNRLGLYANEIVIGVVAIGVVYVVKLLFYQDHKKPPDFPLHHGCRIQDIELLKHYLDDLHYDIDAVDEIGWTALHCAASMGQIDIVELLLTRGANINWKDKNKSTPLHKAVWNGKKLIAFLLEKKADIDAQDLDGTTPLHFAIQKQRMDSAVALIEAGANLDLVDNQGHTPWQLVQNYPPVDPILLAMKHRLSKLA